VRAQSSPENGSECLSPQFMDDHGAHHYHADSILDDYDEMSTLEDDESNPDGVVEEVRFGIRDSRDVDPEVAALEREKSARSMKDPTLVCLVPPTGPDRG